MMRQSAPSQEVRSQGRNQDMQKLGNIRVDKTKCTVCGVCVERCILNNIVLRVAPCHQACPLHLNCQGYAHLVADGKLAEALQEIHQSLPFAGIIGRICSQPCEASCKRKEKDGQSVALRQVKRFLADSLPDAKPDLTLAENRPEKVAIVGSGPAGMMAAFDLRKKGYAVTIFEAQPKYGGMLTWGIPPFRLPPAVVDHEFQLLLDMGVTVKLNTRMGGRLGLEALCRQYDAVFLATGANRSQRLDIPGEEKAGVWSALDFLKECRGASPPSLGSRVLVIGGGNTAVGAAQSARRLGAPSVAVVCLESPAEMPAFAWEVESAREEGVDFHHWWGPARFLSSRGRLSGVEFQRCLRVFDAQGRFAPVFDEEDRRPFPADTVIVATGQLPDLSYLKGRLSQNGAFIKVDPVTLQADNPKVFAGGDVIEGRKTVIDAMAHGRRAAVSIDRFLRGEGLEWGRQEFDESHELEFAVDFSLGSPDPRGAPKKLKGPGRLPFRELERGLTQKEALREAGRCLKCGDPYGKRDWCWHCLPCEIECPYQALRVEVAYLVR